MDSKTFVIRNEEIRHNCIELLKKLTFERLYEVTIKHHRKNRSLEQNSRYWAILTEIATEWAKQGNPYKYPEVWHEYFKREFLGVEILEIQGKVVMLSKSTKPLKVDEFGDFMTKVEAWAVDEGILV